LLDLQKVDSSFNVKLILEKLKGPLVYQLQLNHLNQYIDLYLSVMSEVIKPAVEVSQNNSNSVDVGSVS
jgi:hypothetical protein